MRDNRPVKTTMAVKYTSGTAMIVAEPGVFNVDDILRTPDGSQYVVEAVSGGTSLTVRQLSGSYAATDIGETVQNIGMATPEGKSADNMVRTGIEDLYNYTSILEDVVDLSGSEHESLLRGREDSGELIARKEQELAEKWQSQMVLGIRTKNDLLKTKTTGGIKFLIDTYAPTHAVDFGGSAKWNSNGDAGAIGKVDDVLDLLSAKIMGKPTMYVGGKFMRKFKYAIADTNIQTTTDLNESRGVGKVGTYISHLYGKLDVVLLQERTGWMDDFAFFIDESGLGQKAAKGRDWQTYPLARLGDSFRWQVLSERTVKMENPLANAYLYNF